MSPAHNKPGLFTAADAEAHAARGTRKLRLAVGTIVTPSARDVLLDRGISLELSADVPAAPDPAAMEIIDISMPIHPAMPSYPGLPPPEIRQVASIRTGDGYNAAVASLPTHMGTHVDAQTHHFPNGSGIEDVPMSGLVGIGLVLDLTHVGGGISKAHLAPLDSAGPFDILLLKTANSTPRKSTFERFDPAHIYLEPDAAAYLLDRQIRGLAIDCLSVERYNREGAPTHKILLRENRIAIIEGVDLRRVEPGYYWFACLPIALSGADGAPARAILIRDPSGEWLSAWRKFAPAR